jgi:hypothetical protein
MKQSSGLLARLKRFMHLAPSRDHDGSCGSKTQTMTSQLRSSVINVHALEENEAAVRNFFQNR